MDNNIEKISLHEAKIIIHAFQRVFDVVRFVEPVSAVVYIISDDDSVSFEEYCCYKIWLKTKRCDNCISLKACNELRRITKYEFIDNEVFHVVAQPFVLCYNGIEQLVSLELVNNVSDDLFLDAVGKNNLIEKITAANRKVYEDSLTGVFNRRYFDERVFCNSSKGKLKNNVAFVMLDLKKFKEVNDRFGHDMGDNVLRLVGQALNSCVRCTDSVIRIGGDEFLIVLSDYPEDKINEKIQQMKSKIENIPVGDDSQNKVIISGNFGYAATDKFSFDSSFIKQLLAKADKAMYEDKNKD